MVLRRSIVRCMILSRSFSQLLIDFNVFWHWLGDIQSIWYHWIEKVWAFVVASTQIIEFFQFNCFLFGPYIFTIVMHRQVLIDSMISIQCYYLDSKASLRAGTDRITRFVLLFLAILYFFCSLYIICNILQYCFWRYGLGAPT